MTPGSSISISAPRRGPDREPAGGAGAPVRGDRPSPRGGRALAIEGFFQSIGQGLAGSYLGAYALALGAGGLALGLVATLPTASMAIAQGLARRLRSRVGGARALIGRAWTAQAAGYVALGLCGYLVDPLVIPALCVVIVLLWGTGGLVDPAWSALVSRVVPRSRHGWFFGLRAAAQQSAVLAATLGGGALLAMMTARGQEVAGFALIFAIAGLARLSGTGLLGRVADADVDAGLSGRTPAPGRLPVSRKARRLAFYLWSLHLATQVSSPFFVPYMVRDLGYSYALIGALVSVPPLVKVFTVRFWGRVADRTGPGPVLRVSGWLVVPVAALWLISDHPMAILAAQVYGGIVWGAFELAQASSLLQTSRGRERDIAFFNAVDGWVLVAGALAGGAVASWVDAPGRSGYAATMLLSTVLRVIPAVGLLWRVRGIGRPAWSHLVIPLRLWAIRPTGGISYRPMAGVPPVASARRPGPGAAGKGATAAPVRPANREP